LGGWWVGWLDSVGSLNPYLLLVDSSCCLVGWFGEWLGGSVLGGWVVGWLGVWASGWFVWVVVFVLVLNGWLVGCVGDGRFVLNENIIKSHKLKLLSGLCIVVLCYYIVIVCCVLVGMICLCSVLDYITLIS
jgi:hypothetical protein